MSFDPTKIGQNYTYKFTQVVLPSTAPAQIVAANAYRVAIIFSAHGTAFEVSTVPGFAQNTGIICPNAVTTRFTLNETGPLCQQQFFAQAATGGAITSVAEVLWIPPGV